MAFNFVWGIIENLGVPPDSIELKNIRDGYIFYPFQHNGFIYTADASIWKNEVSVKIHYWPSVENITEIILNRKSGNPLLIIFSDMQIAKTIDSANSAELSRIPEDIEDILILKFEDMGFDVIDISGISAITNIGYSAQELLIIKNDIQTTKYGLIGTAVEAYKFAEFASTASPEHATFFPVRIGFVK